MPATPYKVRSHSQTIVLLTTNDIATDQRMHRVAHCFVEQGFQVHWIGRILPSSKPFSDKIFSYSRLRCWFNRGPLFYAEYNLRLFFLLLVTPCIAIYAADLDTILPQTIVGGIRGKVRIFDAHEHFTEVPELQGRSSIQSIWDAVAHFAIPHQHHCITVGPALAGLFSATYGVPFQVLRNLPYPKPTNSEPLPSLLLEQINRGPFILYQGALNLGRGLPELIHTMTIVPVRLLIAGDGDIALALEEQVNGLQLQDKVVFLGKRSMQELQQLTPYAFIGYNALSPLGLSYYYSLSNKFFDYILAEVPSISSHFPEYTSILHTYPVGITVPDLSTNSLANAILSLVDNHDHYLQLKRNCRTFKSHFTFDNDKPVLTQICNELRQEQRD